MPPTGPLRPTLQKQAASIPSSIGFSGAGFLAAYHLGVADCLEKQKVLNVDSHQITRLTGVSAGALVSSALLAGVSISDGMHAVIDVGSTARQAGFLDSLHPGYSLIDVVETQFSQLLRNAPIQDPARFANHLRVGLTDRRRIGVFRRPVMVGFGSGNSVEAEEKDDAYLYVDEFRDLDDVMAACILSSYVPGVTGPALGSRHPTNRAVVRASVKLQEMIRAGLVKKNGTGEPLLMSSCGCEPASSSDQQHVICWDGGLVNAFPVFDKSTIIVSPIAASFTHPAISPALEYHNDDDDDDVPPPRKFSVTPDVAIHLTAANAATVRYVVLSSDPEVLQAKFSQGYDNATRFLQTHNLVQTTHHPGTVVPSAVNTVTSPFSSVQFTEVERNTASPVSSQKLAQSWPEDFSGKKRKTDGE